MQTPYPNLPAGKMAYIRQVDPQNLPQDVREKLPADAAVWGIHSAEGECLALTNDRRGAFLLARENDLAPVSAH